jgi:hypothetical protein
LGQLVEHYERLTPLEYRIEIGHARRCGGCRVGTDGVVKRFAADLERDLAPQCVRDECRPLRPMDRQFVAGDAGHAAFPRCRQRRAIDQRRRRCGEFSAAKRQVCQRDQCVGLAAAKAGLKAINCRRCIVSRNAQHSVTQHQLETIGGRSAFAEELFGIGVEIVDLPTAAAIMGDHLRQARREHLGIKGALKNAFSGLAAVDDADHFFSEGADDLHCCVAKGNEVLVTRT